MRKRMAIWILAAVLLMIPQAAAKEQDPICKQVIEQLYGEQTASEVVVREDGDNRVISTLTLNQRMDSTVTYTYSRGWMLTGMAEPGCSIDVVVYTISEKGKPIIWYNHTTRVGDSGMYQEEVPLQLLGIQNLLIMVGSQEAIQCRVYPISRKSEETCSQLLQYKLNLYEEYGRS